MIKKNIKEEPQKKEVDGEVTVKEKHKITPRHQYSFSSFWLNQHYRKLREKGPQKHFLKFSQEYSLSLSDIVLSFS